MLEAGRGGRLEPPHPKSPAEAGAALEALIRMALADGVVDPAELKALSDYAARFEIPADAVRSAVQKEKAAMFESAKETLSAGH